MKVLMSSWTNDHAHPFHTKVTTSLPNRMFRMRTGSWQGLSNAIAQTSIYKWLALKHRRNLVLVLYMFAAMLPIFLARKIQPSQPLVTLALQVDLAPCFGKLDKNSITALDENMKIAIAIANLYVEGRSTSEQTWENIISIFMQNPALEIKDVPVYKTTELVKDVHSRFRLKGELVTQEAYTRFKEFIGDQDVLISTGFDTETFSKIVLAVGASVDGVSTSLKTHEYTEKSVVDIVVLRYPDIDIHYFAVYRIQLIAWSGQKEHTDSSQGARDDGINCSFYMRCFTPRLSVINSLFESTKRYVHYGGRSFRLNSENDRSRGVFCVFSKILNEVAGCILLILVLSTAEACLLVGGILKYLCDISRINEVSSVNTTHAKYFKFFFFILAVLCTVTVALPSRVA
ncbi:hypothetical protein SCHPADRAFT_659387 [Schizopora paradoxa]|uniref:Uncharacterized protein n=1 Tax=Schizopora paradoxa TaxID=27342 RepID=A0A0H2R5Q9_9AGAM|nr:hypothetical protein SCHPADRAFT_659387 [Schizopora paradoxa]